ncbi:MAG: STAS domain-containing protein [Vicinamibacterales bacterium]
MQLDDRIVGDVTVVTVAGELTLNKSGDLVLKDKIVSLLQQGRRRLVLAVGGVSYVDSWGLGQLLQVQTAVTKGGGALKLANPDKRLRDLLGFAKLLSIFDIHESEAAAIASFDGHKT